MEELQLELAGDITAEEGGVAGDRGMERRRGSCTLL
jgi:hypothetical protein